MTGKIIDGRGIDSTISLYLRFRGGNNDTVFRDDSHYHHTITPSGDAKISTGQAHFPPTSGYFDGAGDYLSIPDHAAFTIGTRYTISFLVYLPDLIATNPLYIQEGGSGYSPISVGILDTGKIYYLISEDGANWKNITAYQGSHTLSAGVWNRITVVKDGNNLTAYVNGASDYAYTSWTSPYDSSDTLHIGANLYSGNYLKGYLNEVIVWKGVAVDGTKVPTRMLI